MIQREGGASQGQEGGPRSRHPINLDGQEDLLIALWPETRDIHTVRTQTQHLSWPWTQGFRNLKQTQAKLCWSLLPSPERKNGRCSHSFFSGDSQLQLFYTVWWTWNWNIWFFHRKLQEACGLKNWKSCGRPLSWRWCQHSFTERSQEPAIAFEKWL